MPPTRNRRASTSKRVDSGPSDLQFCIEKGETYRPFTDPDRIAKNDAKRSSKGDVRAHVSGVPDKFLGILDVAGEKPSNETGLQCTTQAAAESITEVHDPSGTPPPQESTFRVKVPEENRPGEVCFCDTPEESQFSVYGHVHHPHLRVTIPNVPLPHPCTSSFASPLATLSCHSTIDGSPTSGNDRSSSSLSLPTTIYEGGYDEQSPQLYGFNDGQIINTGLEHHTWSSPDTPDLDPSCGTPDSTSISETNEYLPLRSATLPPISEVHGEHAYGSFDSHCASPALDPSSAKFSELSLAGYMAGSSTLTDTIPQAMVDDTYMIFAEEVQKIFNTPSIRFDRQDLECLDAAREEEEMRADVFTNAEGPGLFLVSDGLASS